MKGDLLKKAIDARSEIIEMFYRLEKKGMVRDVVEPGWYSDDLIPAVEFKFHDQNAEAISIDIVEKSNISGPDSLSFVMFDYNEPDCGIRRYKSPNEVEDYVRSRYLKYCKNLDSLADEIDSDL